MAAKADDRLKSVVDNEGVAEIANSKKTADPHPAARPEISHNAPPPSLPLGEKRKAPSSPDDGGQKKAKPVAMSFGIRPKAGAAAMEGGKGLKSGGITMKLGAAKSAKKVSLQLMQDLAGSNNVQQLLKCEACRIQQDPTENLVGFIIRVKKPKEPELKAPTSRAVAKAFAEDSDDDEEMPPEAKMRMRNVGRETPTSAGPNSYNKSKYGFDDHARVWKKGVDGKLTDQDGNKK